MEAIREKIAFLGLNREEITIEGERAFKFKESRKTAMGNAADEYVPYVSKLALRTPTAVVELDPSSTEFSALARALGKPRFNLPLYDIFVNPGSQAPTETGSFKFGYALVEDIVALDENWLEAMLTDDDEALREIDWKLFVLTSSYAKAPCSRETHDMLRQTITDGYRTSMSFGQYYDWYVRSSANLDEEGNLTETALAKAEKIVDAWVPGTMDAEEVKYWLCRNLEVHPAHRALYEALADDKTTAVTPATAGPRP